ncbi:MFS transporter [Roseivirga misakiensis]|uniref:MFS transporter n=1 Tax=Roseivirga misakiensis TaxID=1563681 RepID=A0A1E5T374_9BACT|nr:MFS transporter [Roseivirga misakiensis]OEK05835.1 MFS transporter [Roseivirga misakiensis]
MNKKPRLSFLQIWNMSFGFLGIQMGFALQNANTSRIFETLGADTENLAVYWLAAPITGLIMQPIIGYYSDRTWSPKWGRRRPYFAFGAIAATIALFLMPNSHTLWMAVGVLWIMDASINVTMEPFRAFVGDLLPDEQRTSGFAMQSFFIGIGALVASFMPWIFTNWFNIPNTDPDGGIPPSVKYAFYVGGIMYLITVLWTVFTTKEYPPEEDEHHDVPAMDASEEGTYVAKFNRVGLILLSIGIAFSLFVYFMEIDVKLHILGGGFAFFGLIHLLGSRLVHVKKTSTALVHIVKDFNSMPNTMIQLAVVQFFSWFALFSMWIFCTPAVTSHIYGTTDTASAAYNEGANMVSNLFGGYNGIAAIAAIFIPLIARKTSRKMTHLIALCCGGIGLISIYFISEPQMLWLSMIGVGIAWASILSVPYAILSGALPSDKMGYYMGVFNFFVVIPQIVAASLLGFILNTFLGGQTVLILVVGGVSMILSGFLTLRVKDTQ